LPGGHVDRGETIRRACEREFLEETGLSVVAGPCLAVADVAFVQDGSPVQEVTIVFHVEPRDNSIVGDDTPNAVASLEPKIAFEWVEVGELKRRDLRPACVKDWVEALSARPLSDATATTFLEQHDPPRRST
jgi:ADP-ribose pyrophosphatase YjhB (NUDIX family)